MNTNRFSTVLSVMLAMCFLMSACSTKPVTTYDENSTLTASLADGNVVAVGLMDTMRGLAQVYRMDPGTLILQSPKGDFLLAWTRGNAWEFIGITGEGNPITDFMKLTGNKANTMTFTDLVMYLEKNNWQYVFPTSLPAWFVTSIETSQSFMIQFGSFVVSFPILMIMPAGVDGLDPTYLGQQ